MATDTQQFAAAEGKFSKQNITRLLVNNALYVVLLLLIVGLTLATPNFLTIPNITNILRQVSFQAIVAVGMTMVIILAQIDLSVGSVVAFAAVVNAILIKAGIPIPASLLITVVLSSFWGAFSGWVTAKFNLHAFLVTLAMMTLIRGVTYLITGGYPVSGLPMEFLKLGSGYFFGIPLPIIYMAVVFAVGIFVMNKTPFGRAIYAIGGNAEAARLSGLNVNRIKVAVFAITAGLAGFVGIILSSRLMAGSPELGIGWELDVIAAVIIGGTSMFGGSGRLQGTLLGVLFVGILTNGMILLDINPYMQQVAKGLLILGAVVLNSLKRDA
ncbi:ribose ABC transport system permease protein RbsC [Vibrio variabilis]|uniref:Ribose ABC transport system permease protein RbsC n=1 Tax=Vibrio variabilis TaxID=990271 RepID=A0ABQ0JER6_9VIBR|nr:ribose ABC transport system permease protein RbsC [Vibrio variabilis]